MKRPPGDKSPRFETAPDDENSSNNPVIALQKYDSG
jgi:hypothetical protein